VPDAPNGMNDRTIPPPCPNAVLQDLALLADRTRGLNKATVVRAMECLQWLMDEADKRWCKCGDEAKVCDTCAMLQWSAPDAAGKP
jgi:hypothetical protein